MLVIVDKMKTAELDINYYAFGNKGAVWSDEVHIAKNGSHSTLCGTPMLSRNWARINEHPTVGCPKCLEIYNQQKG